MPKLEKPTEEKWEEKELTEFEAATLRNLRVIQNSVAEMIREVQANLLGNAAGTRWGFAESQTLQYDFDFEEGSNVVKVRVVNEKSAEQSGSQS